MPIDTTHPDSSEIRDFTAHPSTAPTDSLFTQGFSQHPYEAPENLFDDLISPTPDPDPIVAERGPKPPKPFKKKRVTAAQRLADPRYAELDALIEKLTPKRKVKRKAKKKKAAKPKESPVAKALKASAQPVAPKAPQPPTAPKPQFVRPVAKPLDTSVRMRLTEKQLEAQEILAGPATHCMLFGGSRSGKTFLLVRNTALRALKAPNSRHAILRFRFNSVKASVVLDTFPKVMKLCFPGVEYRLDKTDWFAEFNNGSQIWFGGLDDKERTEKILGMEFATIYLNESSQIPKSSRDLAVTRLAQQVNQIIQGRPEKPLKPRMYYDCNPPSKAHWTYALFVDKRDPDTKLPLLYPDDYACFKINPGDNAENISPEYLATLQGLSARLQKRFLKGEFADATPNALFHDEDFDKWRYIDRAVPEFVRVVVGVDPSGSDDTDNADNDAIGIVVGALGVDGNAYLLEDCTVKAGPATWARVAAHAYDRHEADVVVGEQNYGGAMVKATIQTARPRTPYRAVKATRGKAVRAEPFSALYEQGKIRHVGDYPELEDELCAFSTNGYMGNRSPNRADAWIWVLSELFGGIVAPQKKFENVMPIPVANKWR